MFRRTRRLINRTIQRPAIPALLKRAHQFMANSDYANAEKAFHQLAQKAELKFPQHAPMLYVQAGRASILNNQTQKGMAHFRSGLTLLGAQNRFARLQKIGNIIISELRERNLNAEANEIAQTLKNNLPSTWQKEPPISNKKIILPAHCPFCGAIVKPNEVEWLDEFTAECDYCGSPLREEA